MIIVLCLVLLVQSIDLEAALDDLDRWDFIIGPATPVVFAAAYVVGTLILLPASAFTVAAGAIFGFWIGLLVSSVASTAAAVVAFLVARHLLRESIERRATRFPRFGAVDRAIGRDGGSVVLLLRLMPGFPVSIGNYLLGLTKVRLGPYVLATWIGMLPSTIVFAAAGAVGRRSLTALTLNGVPDADRLALMLLGAVGLSVLLLIVGVRIKRRVQLRLREAHAELLAEKDRNADTDDDSAEPALPPSTLATVTLAILAVTALTILLFRLTI